MREQGASLAVWGLNSLRVPGTRTQGRSLRPLHFSSLSATLQWLTALTNQNLVLGSNVPTNVSIDQTHRVQFF